MVSHLTKLNRELAESWQALRNEQRRGVVEDALRHNVRQGRIESSKLVATVFEQMQVVAGDKFPYEEIRGWSEGTHFPRDEIALLALEWCAPGRGFPEIENGCIVAIRLTEAGRVWLSGLVSHPFTLGFETAIEGLPAGIRDRLQDAVACFRAALLRPTCVMLGVAYEDAIGMVASRWGVVRIANSAERLVALGQKIAAANSAKTNAALRDAIIATGQARAVADARNAAAHPDPARLDPIAVETMLRDAPRWLRALLFVPQ